MSNSTSQPASVPAFLQLSLGHGPTNLTLRHVDDIALWLRLGLGSVFVLGGWWKLSRALDPSRADALVARYTGPDGYINAFFQDYLFTDGFLTPWIFLTALSAFELIAGIAFMLGFFVRPLAILFGVMMWSFVAALPVLTTPGIDPEQRTYLTPAMIVQIRDIGLSGFCFVLAIMGSGRWSIDADLMGRGAPFSVPNWIAPGLLLRLSMALVFLAAGSFYGLDHVKSWSDMPILMILIGVFLASGYGVRIAASAALAVLLVHIFGAMDPERAFWDDLNAVKREFAFVAAAIVLIRFSGGTAFQAGRLLEAPFDMLFGPGRERPAKADT